MALFRPIHWPSPSPASFPGCCSLVWRQACIATSNNRRSDIGTLRGPIHSCGRGHGWQAAKSWEGRGLAVRTAFKATRIGSFSSCAPGARGQQRLPTRKLRQLPACVALWNGQGGGFGKQGMGGAIAGNERTSSNTSLSLYWVKALHSTYLMAPRSLAIRSPSSLRTGCIFCFASLSRTLASSRRSTWVPTIRQGTPGQ